MVTSNTFENTNKSRKEYLPGFKDRFYAICAVLDKKKFGRIRFLTTISGLSWSGAKVCIENDRPPKRVSALRSIANELSQELKRKTNIAVTPAEVEEYLVVGSGPLEDRLQGFIETDLRSLGKWDISTISASLNARVVLMIHKLANEMGIDVFSDLDKQQFELLNRKMVVYCHQHSDINEMETDLDVMELIRSMIIVAHAKLQ